MIEEEEFTNLLLFSTWPRQSMNKNESEFLIFSKYFDIIPKKAIRRQMFELSIDDEPMNVDRANNKRSLGNKYYKDKKYDLAVQHYTESVLYAPRNSKEFALAVANRSAALFDMEKYRECLQDINRAMKSDYPEELKYKILIRQSKCYLKLNLNVEATKSLTKAEEYVDKIKLGKTLMLIKETIAEIKNQLKDELGTNVTDVPDNKFISDLILIEPSLKNGNNPKFLNAAQVVDYKYNNILGRHVVANTDINRGDVLFIEEPYSFMTIDRPGIYDTCSFCLQNVSNCIPCTECSDYMYCSDECCLSAWNNGHQWECVGVRRKIISNQSQKLALNILFKASYDGFQTTIKDESIYGQENNYPFVDKLVTNKSKTSKSSLKKFTKEAVWMVLYLKNYTNYFNWLLVQPNCPVGTKEQLYKFIGGQLLKYLLQIQSNAVLIQEGSVQFDPKDYGCTKRTSIAFGIYISTALLNHACLPNAVKTFDETKCIIRARDFIKKGTEVTINYLIKSYYGIIEKKERKALLKKYAFTCTCSGCIQDSAMLDYYTVLLCPRCSGRAFLIDETIIQCIDCQRRTVSPIYSLMYTRLREILAKGEILEDYKRLDEMQKLMEHIFHKQNTQYLLYYNLRLQQYEKTGELKKCVEIAKKCLELIEPNVGDIYALSMLVTYVYFLLKYCATLKKQNSKDYKKNMDLAKEMVKKSALLLQYYASNKNIEKYVAKMLKFFNTGHIEMINTCEFNIEYKLHRIP